PGSGVAFSDTGHCSMGSGLITTAAGPRFFYGLGIVKPGASVQRSTLGFTFDAQTQTFFGPYTLPVAVSDVGSVNLGTSAVGMFGGDFTHQWARFSGLTFSGALGAVNLKLDITGPSPAALADGRVMFFGGNFN